jgi:hypothetical protein
MQEKEYAQIYEFGLGSLIGDFFQNVKDTVTGVAKAVAPIAPFVLPFVAPGIGSLVGGKLGSFLASKGGQYLLGAGIQGLAGKKPADIAKNLALQVATSGIQGALSDRSGNIGQRFMSGVTGRDLPSVTGRDLPSVREADFAKAIQGDISSGNLMTNVGGSITPPEMPEPTFMDRLSKSLGQTFDPTQRTVNPKYAQLEALGVAPEKIIASGISPEAPFTYQYGPALYAGLTALPLVEQFLTPQEEEEEDTGGYENLYAQDPSAYQIGSITGYNPDGYYLPEGMRDQYMANQIGNEFMIPMSFAAEGGEMVTGFAQGSGQQIKHPDGKVREHPKRIGEIAGPGTGTSDDIPAMLSDGEFVMTAKAVRNAGGGSRKEGAKNMYKMMKSLENGGSLSQQSIGMA